VEFDEEGPILLPSGDVVHSQARGGERQARTRFEQVLITRGAGFCVDDDVRGEDGAMRFSILSVRRVDCSEVASAGELTVRQPK